MEKKQVQNQNKDSIKKKVPENSLEKCNQKE